MSNKAITLTFGECAENHVGMQMLGKKKAEGQGFTEADLLAAGQRAAVEGLATKMVKIERPPGGREDAWLLIIKQAVRHACPEIDREMDSMVPLFDTKAFMRGRVVNKHARHNIIIGHEDQEPEYDKGKGRVVRYDSYPQVRALRDWIQNTFGEKATGLYAEGNLYYDQTCGIGFHGDTERRLVVAARLGERSEPMHYQWYQQSKAIGGRIIIPIDVGDVYAMSEKAVGTDWKKRIVPTLRHATGHPKYTTTVA